MRQLFHRTIYRLRCTSRRVAIGWRFAIGRSRADDGYNLLHAGEELTGAYSLESLYVCSLTDSLVDRYGEEHRAVLEELAERACSRVASKWDSTDDIQGWAEEWAGELVAELRWLSDEASRRENLTAQKREAIRLEMADVLIFLLRLGDVLEVDLAQAARDKLAINETRFAVRES